MVTGAGRPYNCNSVDTLVVSVIRAGGFSGVVGAELVSCRTSTLVNFHELGVSV